SISFFLPKAMTIDERHSRWREESQGPRLRSGATQSRVERDCTDQEEAKDDPDNSSGLCDGNSCRRLHSHFGLLSVGGLRAYSRQHHLWRPAANEADEGPDRLFFPAYVHRSDRPDGRGNLHYSTGSNFAYRAKTLSTIPCLGQEPVEAYPPHVAKSPRRRAT